jgi:hypothetical protein
MDRLARLESHTEQLSAAVTNLMKHRHGGEPPEAPQPTEDTDRELSNAKASILASIASIKALVSGPDDLLQDLATQVTSPTLCPLSFFHLSFSSNVALCG